MINKFGIGSLHEKHEIETVEFILHSNKPPYKRKHVNLTTMDHFSRATVAHDKRNEQSDFSIVVIFTHSDHVIPCKLIKLRHTVLEHQTKGCKTVNVSHDRNADFFANCFLVENDKVLLLTYKYIALYDDNLTLLQRQEASAIHSDVKKIEFCDPIFKHKNKTHYFFICRMKSVSTILINH